MNIEEKQLLLKDIFARIPYGVKVEATHLLEETHLLFEGFVNKRIGILSGVGYLNDFIVFFEDNNCDLFSPQEIKPYLRPMSSMTEKERNDFENASHNWFYVNEDSNIYPMGRITDSGEFEYGILAGIEYLLKNHYDFRGLIPMGLALEAPKGMY